MDRRFYHTTNTDAIVGILSAKSPSSVSYIEDHICSKFSLWYKDVKHADLISCGKSTPNKFKTVKGKKILKKRVDPEYEKNVLNYLSVDEMKRIAKKTKKAFPTAHQSNIHVSDDFLTELGVSDRKKGFPCWVSFFLVNDSLTYFTKEYTSKVANKLSKNTTNCSGKDVRLSEGHFTEISLGTAAHGIGTSKDTVFHELRENIFTNDRIYFLVESAGSPKKVFILLDKNPIFFQIIGKGNSAWVKYLERVRQHEDERIRAHEPLAETTTRSLQSEWKDNLARELMSQTDHENEVFCPFTGITADYDKVATLFRASHIVSFSDSELTEKYDINNGLLLCANADALFDKHLISVNDEGKLVFSFLLNNNTRLKTDLHLNQGIYGDILNKDRKAYLHQHYKIFKEKEERRRTEDYRYVED